MTNPLCRTIAFDADDTLWHNEVVYAQAKERFADIMRRYVPAQDARDGLDEAEIANIELLGYGIKSFTLSMIEIALKLSEERLRGEDLQRILTLSRDMHAEQPVLVDHVEMVLKQLSKKDQLIMITKGDLVEQQRKIHASGLRDFFQAIEIVPEKDESTYRDILFRHQISSGQFWMVGNSLRSDILPVVAIGSRAVYIPNASAWDHENAVHDQHADFLTLDKLDQLPALLEAIDADDEASG